MLSTSPAERVEEQKLPRLFRYLDWIVAVLVIARCAWVFSALLRSSDVPLRLAQDDFYYYLKPAQNLAWFHHATFFQNTLTNGYHPLYFALLAVVSISVHTLTGVFRFLWALDTVSAAAIFLLTRRLFGRVCGPLLANALAVLVTALTLTQICDQMEVTLVLPLGFAFLLSSFVAPRQITARRAMVMGILGALTSLARLDAGLLVLLWVVGALCTREYRAAFTGRHVGSFLAASLPLPLLYVLLNHHYFGTILPISATAKELRHGFRPSLLVPVSFSGMSEFLVFGALAAAILAWGMRRFLQARERVFLFAVLFAPFVFYGLEMVVSDWPVWNWYFYVLRFSAAGIALLVAVLAGRSVIPARYPTLRSLLASPAFGALLCAVGLLKLFVANYKVDVVMVDIQHGAEVLAGFARSHPGVYAMGDRGGMFATLTPNPVLQAEGLAMDRTYLSHIRRQDDLRQVLASYGVNYYVAFVFDRRLGTQFSGPCFHAMEPSLAGASTLRMRSDFCEAPVLQFPGYDGKYLVYRIQPQDKATANSGED